ncbi:hypothetical protein [Wolbachia endosymbiont (group B) of Ischnura elegans]|uniref:hypothetical protein n=1 Tax=Wolbachia endosymbiont (group B) of Ischnura elegans TaxID=2954021 RepID=UPI00222E1346|nr:hypothetical protein [Wolbachia endosymbiont (group B) of Ischnura elegans]
MSKNSQNLLQRGDNVTDNSGKQLISALDLITLKTATGKDVKDLTRIVTGDTVKKAIDELANNINKQLIISLNTMLEKEQAKVKSLEDIIGDETQGLQKNLADLTAQVNNMLPEEAPPYHDML